MCATTLVHNQLRSNPLAIPSRRPIVWNSCNPRICSTCFCRGRSDFSERQSARNGKGRPPLVTDNSVREIMVATTMNSLFVALFALVASSFRTRAALQAEILALRHQLAVLQKNAPRRLRFHRCDRLLWVVLSRFWSGWRRCLQMVQPDTVLRWHRRAFAWHWTRKSRRLPGRPEVASNIRDLIRRMSQANPLWGAPRIHGELLKLGIAAAQSTVARYLPWPRKPPSQGRKSLRLCLSGVMRIRWFDPIPKASEL